MSSIKLSSVGLVCLIFTFQFVLGCDGTTGSEEDPQDTTAGDGDGDADTDTDADTDGDADTGDGTAPQDFTPEELELHRNFDWDQFCADQTFDTIDPSWLTYPYAGTWPDPASTTLQMGACSPNYDATFWTRLACYNQQPADNHVLIDGDNFPCFSGYKDAPPSSTPFSCTSYRCKFCESLTQTETTRYYYPDICTEENARWECTSCYYELMKCLWNATETGVCDIETHPKMYEVQQPLIDCYMQVTGYDRCRFVLPDVCEGVDECSGPEWPPV